MINLIKKIEPTDSGVKYAKLYLTPLLEIEQNIVAKMGQKKSQELIDAANLYGSILQSQLSQQDRF